jgi:hypothetical protein
MPILVIDCRTARMGLKNSNRNNFFTAFYCLNLKATTFVFAAYNKLILV